MTRELKQPFNYIFIIWALIGALYHIYGIYIGVITAMIHHALHVGFVIPLIFLLYKKDKSSSSDSIPWYDLCAALLGVITTTYVVVNYYSFLYRLVHPTFLDCIMGTILILLILEASRRTVGIVIPILTIICLFYSLYGYLLSGNFWHREYTWARIVAFQYMGLDGIFGLPTRVASTYVFLFLLFGAFLLKSGGGEFLIKLASSVAGRWRGGPGSVAVVSSALFGTISGSAIANTATTGQFTIPLMIHSGYKPTLAAAIEAVASAGGTFTPPIMGAGAFIMAEMLGIRYLVIIKAAIVPALLFYIGLFVAVYLEAKKQGIVAIPKSELPDFKKTLKQGIHVLIPIFLLIFLIANYYPIMRAVLYSLAAAIILLLFQKKYKLTIFGLLDILVETMKNVLPVSSACISAGIIAGTVALTGLGPKVSAYLIEVSGGSIIVALFLTMIIIIILGLGLIPTSAYIVGVSITALALIELGVSPLQAHFFIFYFSCLGVITPPVCLGAYVAAGLAKTSPFKTGLTAFSLGFVAFIVPYFFIGSPELLLGGITEGVSTWAIVITIITAIIGTIALAMGLRGYFLRPMNIVERFFISIGGIVMVEPKIFTDLIGLFIILVVIIYHIRFIFKKQKRTHY